MKVAFQAPRFWETRERDLRRLELHQPRHLHHLVSQLRLLADEGVLVAGYSFGRRRTSSAPCPWSVASLTPATRWRSWHPGQGGQLRAPVTVSWKDVPFNHGIECALASRPGGYALLSEADGPFWFAGEHLSHVGAWQQGAFASAHRTVKALDARHRESRPVDAVRQQG